MTGFRGIDSSRGSRWLGLALLTTWVGACGGGGATPAVVSAGPTTGQAGCVQLAKTFCARSMQCNAPDAGAPQIADCIRINGVVFGCDQVTTQDFTSCATDIQGLSCPGLFPDGGAVSPPSCDTPFSTIPLSAAKMKCGDLAEAYCEKIVTCEMLTVTNDDLAQCQSDIYDQLGCFLASDVGAGFDQCVAGLKSAPCLNGDGGAASSPDGGSTTIPACDNAITFADETTN